jgi:hypothetical protein
VKRKCNLEFSQASWTKDKNLVTFIIKFIAKISFFHISRPLKWNFIKACLVLGGFINHLQIPLNFRPCYVHQVIQHSAAFRKIKESVLKKKKRRKEKKKKEREKDKRAGYCDSHP